MSYTSQKWLPTSIHPPIVSSSTCICIHITITPKWSCSHQASQKKPTGKSRQLFEKGNSETTNLPNCWPFYWRCRPNRKKKRTWLFKFKYSFSSSKNWLLWTEWKCFFDQVAQIKMQKLAHLLPPKIPISQLASSKVDHCGGSVELLRHSDLVMPPLITPLLLEQRVTFAAKTTMTTPWRSVTITKAVSMSSCCAATVAAAVANGPYAAGIWVVAIGQAGSCFSDHGCCCFCCDNWEWGIHSIKYSWNSNWNASLFCWTWTAHPIWPKVTLYLCMRFRFSHALTTKLTDISSAIY